MGEKQKRGAYAPHFGKSDNLIEYFDGSPFDLMTIKKVVGSDTFSIPYILSASTRVKGRLIDLPLSSRIVVE
jgi:hypothetical protein